MIRPDEFEILDGGGGWSVTEPIDASTGFEPNVLPIVTPLVVQPVEEFPVDPFPVQSLPSPVIYQTAPQVFEPAPVEELPEPKPMYSIEPKCNCIMEPCDCDGFPTKIDPLPMPYEPGPSTVYLGGQEPPPIVKTVSVTPRGSGVTPVPDETFEIFGYPWYYVAGAGVGALILLSVLGGEK